MLSSTEVENEGVSSSKHTGKYIIVVAFLASAMGFIDGTIVAIALPQIRSALNASFAQAQWISNAYVLTLAAFILIGGSLGDRLGIKRIFMVGVGLFIMASGACTIAWNAESLIIFRALQGIGAAIMLPGSMSLIARNTPRKERARAMGLWIASSSSMTAIGPLVGGFVLTYGGSEAWRWIFALNLPIGLLALIILLKQVPTDRPSHVGRLSQLDWIGAVWLTVALAILAAGLTFLTEEADQTNALFLLLLGLGLLAGAIVWELRTRNAMVDMRLFRSRVFSGVNAITFLIWTCMGALTFFLPMLVIVAWKLPPSYAGSMFLPFSLLITALSPLAGRLVGRFGTRAVMLVGCAIYCMGCLAFARAIAYQDFWTGLLPAFAIAGLGIGVVGPTISTAVINSVPEDRTGSASGINNMMARLSFLFAVAGLGALVSYMNTQVIRSSSLHKDIQELMVQAGFGQRLEGGLYQISTVELQEVAMNHAMIGLFLLLAVLSVVAIIICWFTQVDSREDHDLVGAKPGTV